MRVNPHVCRACVIYLIFVLVGIVNDFLNSLPVFLLLVPLLRLDLKVRIMLGAYRVCS